MCSLEVVTDRVESPSNTVGFMLILMLILANSNIFLIHPDTVELTIALKIFLKFNENCISLPAFSR